MADNTRVRMTVRGAEVVTVPIDPTLSIAGQAADAKATGDALAGKVDTASIMEHVRITFDGVQSDNQGQILAYAGDIPMAEGGDSIAEKLAGVDTSIESLGSTQTIMGTRMTDMQLDLATLKNKRVSVDEQTLTAAQQTQARTNIGAAADAEVVKTTSQSLGDTQKAQARDNIGAAAAGATVLVTEQSLTDAQQMQARRNIGAAGSGEAVLVAEQSLTDTQKGIARANIGAAGTGDAVLVTTEQSFTENQKAQARQNIGAMPADLAAALAGLWLRRSYGYEFSDLAAGSTLSGTKANFEIETIEGYEIFTVSRVYCANGNAVITRWQAQGEATVVTIRNMASSAISGTVNIDMIYIRSGLRG